MLYLSVKSIYLALKKIQTPEGKLEHTTGRAANGLATHYFDKQKFSVTPEQIQTISNKRPDLSVERIEHDNFVPHLYFELKSLVNKNFDEIMDQLYDTILETVDCKSGSFSVFVIAMKGTKIAFFQFYSYQSLLQEHGIANYRGFIPLNQLIPAYEWMDINKNHNLIDYLKYIGKYSMPTNHNELIGLGVEYTKKIPFPHIWDLLNDNHKDHVHKLFQQMAENKPGMDIVD